MLTPLTTTQKAVLGGLMLLVVGACLGVVRQRSLPPPPLPTYPAQAPPAPALTVDVVGAVLRPGVQQVPAGSRLDAAVQAAGGFAANADRYSVNLAKVLKDGDQVVVRALLPAAAGTPTGRRGAAPPATRRGAAATHLAPPPAAPAVSFPLSLTTATPEQLDQVPGLGPKTVAGIVAYRTRYGGFRRVDELLLISGLGLTQLEKLRPYLTP
ncbi:MAG TPA: helix-hairpin-helix domain-containing protein [Armatimonadota bacterium]|jgi:competence protein ComEA